MVQRPGTHPHPTDSLTAGPLVQAPRLPRVYVPRTRLWKQLDDTAGASVRLLVAPVGAGKTLGVGGWVRNREPAAQMRWISGDGLWDPKRMAELLDDPGDPGGRTLVVVDDAHLLPPATLRAVDERLATDPEGLQLLLLARYDVPLHPADARAARTPRSDPRGRPPARRGRGARAGP